VAADGNDLSEGLGRAFADHDTINELNHDTIIEHHSVHSPVCDYHEP
jgi:hypothetical protein